MWGSNRTRRAMVMALTGGAIVILLTCLVSFGSGMQQRSNEASRIYFVSLDGENQDIYCMN